MISFIFWYWVPAFNVINKGYLVENALVTDMELLHHSVNLVFIYYIVTILISVLVASYCFKGTITRKVKEITNSRLLVASTFVAISATALLLVKYRNEDVKVIYDLISGTVSARDILIFFNKSASPAVSIIALWEIITTWCALYLISIYSLRGCLLSIPGSLNFLTVTIMFVSSGTRSILVMTLLIVLITKLIQRPYDLAKSDSSRFSKKTGYVVILLLLCLVAFSYKARFEDTLDLGSTIFLSTLSNNDMFSELVFVLSNFPQNISTSMFDFLFTPFSFIFPTFLGFSKHIPSHLLEFNMSRAGIDLLTDEGNVFPGIIADFHMNFGFLGPIVFSICVAIIIVLLAITSKRIKDPLLKKAFVITFLSYVFISFRNVQGSLILVLVIGLMFQSLLTIKWHDRMRR